MRINQQGATVNPTVGTEGRMSGASTLAGIAGAARALGAGVAGLVDAAGATRAAREEADKTARLGGATSELLKANADAGLLFATGQATPESIASLLTGLEAEGTPATPEAKAKMQRAYEIGRTATRMAEQGMTQEAINLFVNQKLITLMQGNEDLADEFLTLAGKNLGGANFANVDSDLRKDIEARAAEQRRVEFAQRETLLKYGFADAYDLSPAEVSLAYREKVAPVVARIQNRANQLEELKQLAEMGNTQAELAIQDIYRNPSRVDIEGFSLSAQALQGADAATRAQGAAALEAQLMERIRAAGGRPDDPRFSGFFKVLDGLKIDTTTLTATELEGQNRIINARTNGLVAQQKYNLLSDQPGMTAAVAANEALETMPETLRLQLFANIPDVVLQDVQSFVAAAGARRLAADNGQPEPDIGAADPLPPVEELNNPVPVISRQARKQAQEGVKALFATAKGIAQAPTAGRPETYAGVMEGMKAVLGGIKERRAKGAKGMEGLEMEFFKSLGDPDMAKVFGDNRFPELDISVREDLATFAEGYIAQLRGELNGTVMGRYGGRVVSDDAGRLSVKFDNLPRMRGGMNAANQGVYKTKKYLALEAQLNNIARAIQHVEGRNSDYRMAAEFLATELNDVIN